MSVQLKIKSKHLSEEARIIKFEEKKLLNKVQRSREFHHESGMNDEYNVWKDKNWKDWYSLERHRKWDVRNEQRATFLVRAYLAGVPYNRVEQKRNDEHLFNAYIVPRICAMVVKYGPRLDGDWEWDKAKNRYIATKHLKDKIIAWSKI